MRHATVLPEICALKAILLLRPLAGRQPKVYYMKKKHFNLLRSPLSGILVLLTLSLSFCLTSSFRHRTASADNGKFVIAAVNAASQAVSGELSVCTTTATTTASATTVTTTVTTSPYEVIQPTVTVGQSPNSSFYQERLAVAGDSLALGMNYYGFIPDMHSITGQSVSLWNLDYFTFDMGGGEMGMVDAIDYVHPRLLYMAVGMNDVNLNYPDTYVERYRQVIDEIMRRMPDINIVVAAITPVCSYCNVVRNDIIRDYNAALAAMVEDMDSQQVVFFDVYSLLCDEALDLREDYTSGDGMHLYIPCYTDILTALFDFLDTTDFKRQLGG